MNELQMFALTMIAIFILLVIFILGRLEKQNASLREHLELIEQHRTEEYKAMVDGMLELKEKLLRSQASK